MIYSSRSKIDASSIKEMSSSTKAGRPLSLSLSVLFLTSVGINLVQAVVSCVIPTTVTKVMQCRFQGAVRWFRNAYLSVINEMIS
jgi:hypothetical protein